MQVLGPYPIKHAAVQLCIEGGQLVAEGRLESIAP